MSLEIAEDSTTLEVALGAGKQIATGAAKPQTPLDKLKRENGVPFLVVPKDMEVKSLVHLLPPPEDRRAAVSILTADSFFRYFNDYKTNASRLFGNVTGTTAEFVAIFDYHESGVKGKPGWGRHTARYIMQTSPEWQVWMEKNRERMNQVEFALMVEEGLPDFKEPTGSDMLAMALHFEANPDVKYESVIKLANGNYKLNSEETSNAMAGGKEVPDKFTLGIPVFFGAGAVEVHARLRTRLHSGNLKLWYELIRPHQIIKEGFDEALKMIEKECKSRVTMGSASLPIQPL